VSPPPPPDEIGRRRSAGTGEIHGRKDRIDELFRVLSENPAECASLMGDNDDNDDDDDDDRSFSTSSRVAGGNAASRVGPPGARCVRRM
jgi:hypothetical protein